ncbi:enterobactin synthetase component D [Izhakiella capsodis]|uniref:Enterobactin synthase component D n=1 Tax=Izhakiella capsodis TaxID=1367852 RepID=A0A1I4XDI5_9GAMM|nr:enterobactin synthase subunit EntD [Izhakiella capsodis]SFN23954.1 enterobactin synthetase component D [Izhakiella capsodis]
MDVQHTVLSLAGYPIHRIDFDPLTFSEADLLWLPHHHQLQNAVRKRKAEHLAGRLAAAHALRDRGSSQIPAIGSQRQPLWPSGLFGSISHCNTTALALIAPHPVGVDIESIMTPGLCDEIVDTLLNKDEQRILLASSLPLPMALTLAFSAKESLYKACGSQAPPHSDFTAARVISLSANSIALALYPTENPHYAGRRYQIHWQRYSGHIVTLCTTPCSPTPEISSNA